MKKSFQFQVPVTLSKNDKGDWRVSGLASTEDIDRQGEKILQRGLNIKPLETGAGIFNLDHSNAPGDIVGKIDKAYFSDRGLMVEGYLLKEVSNAKSIYQVMSSLKPEDKQKVFSLSVEGKIESRGGKGDKTIKAATIDRVAFTTKPVNSSCFVELVKSLSPSVEIKKMFKQAIIKKALSIGFPQTSAPAARSGGGVLAPESLGKPKKKPGEIAGVTNVGFKAAVDLFSSNTKKSFKDDLEKVDYILKSDVDDVELDDE
jgi:hypothetical protein